MTDLTLKYNTLITKLLDIEPDFIQKYQSSITATYGDYFLTLKEVINKQKQQITIEASFQFDGLRKDAPVYVLHCNDSVAIKSVEVDTELGVKLSEKLLGSKGNAAQIWAIDKFLEGTN